MHHFRLYQWVAVLVLPLLEASSLSAQEPAELQINPHWTFALQFENDIFANTDSNYTNGVRLSWTSPGLAQYRDAGTLPSWIYKFAKHLPLIQEEGIQRNVVLSLGQNMFTPQDIALTMPDPNDRPYAGWLYMGIAFHNKTERWMDVMELSLGVTGPASLAEDTQRIVHKLKKVQIPQGWDYQIKNEPAINLVWTRSLRMFRIGDTNSLAADGFGHFGGSLGTLYTYANGGFTIRGGWNLPNDFGTAAIRMAGDLNAPASRDDPRLRNRDEWGVALFVFTDGRAVARDGTLDGNLFRDSRSVDKETLVMDAGFGISAIADRWKVSYSQVARSREFKNQEKSWHVYGSVTIAYTY